MHSFNTAITLGNVALSWNAIMLALGILTAVVVSAILVRKRKAYKDLALDACIVGIPAGILGARLFSAISGKIAFSRFFFLNDPGLNLPGALLFSGIAIAVYARIKKFRLKETFDLLLPGAFFGLAVGRWSDFFLCDGLGKIVSSDALKFFPLATFTPNYAQNGEVAYAIFFLDFLVCAALGVTALLLSKKLEKGRTTRLCAILYLFAEFILEWLRDGASRQLVVGGVRFNQIVLILMLGFFIGLSLYRTKKSESVPAAEAEPETAEPKAEAAYDAPQTEQKSANDAPQTEQEAAEPAAEPSDDPTPDESAEDPDGGDAA